MSGFVPYPVIRGSNAPTICHCHGTKAPQLVKLWRIGRRELEPDDLSENYAVQHGAHCEPLVRRTVAKLEGVEITEVQRELVRDGISGTIDGYIPSRDCIYEGKVLTPHWASQTIGEELGYCEWFAPQVAVYMWLRGASKGGIGAQQGTSPPTWHLLNIDDTYIKQVIERMLWFKRCVDEGRPPAPLPPMPVLPELWRTVDLDASTKENWCPILRGYLDQWRLTKPGWAEHEQAKADIKNIIPPDVGEVRCGAITVKRSRNGALTTREKAA